MRSAALAPLLVSLLAGACGKAVDPEPPLGGPDDDCTVPTLTDAPAPASALTAFAYDREAIYDPEIQLLGIDGTVAIHELSFLSPRGTDRATGRLFVPEGAGPFAGMLLMHGMPGNAEQMTAYGGTASASRPCAPAVSGCTRTSGCSPRTSEPRLEGIS